MSIPTKGEEFAKLMEYLRRSQESSAMLAHLTADESRSTAQGWLAISEMFKMVQSKVTELATKGLH